MATKKKIKKSPAKSKNEGCTFRSIMDAIGGFCVALSILVLSVGMYKMVMHLITINKLP
jgi:hypothetical protein